MRLRLVLAFALIAGSGACGLFEQEPPRNLLVIVVNGLRFDAISSSAGAPKTPNIRKLIDDGVPFSWCFSHSPASMPAQAALLSARTPGESGVRSNFQDVDPDLPLVAQHLQKRGWQTFAAVSLPELVPSAPDKGLDRGFDQFRASGPDPATAAEVNTRALAFLERADPATPWFAYVQYSDPTAPYDAHDSSDASAQVLLDGRVVDAIQTAEPSAWRHSLALTPGAHQLELRSTTPFRVRRFACGSSAGELPYTFVQGALAETVSNMVVSLDNTSAVEVQVELSAYVHDVPERAETRARYKLEVESVDRALGVLLATLKAKGLYDATTIVLTADHGEALGEHKLIGHDLSLYDEVLRVPLIFKPAKDSGNIPPLRAQAMDLVRQCDIIPTALALLGEKRLPGASGVSILDEVERELLAETHPPEAPSTMCMIRDVRYKLIYIALEDRYEMYDIRSDTLEMDNVFTLQGHFRRDWQRQLKELTMRSPQAANVRMGMAKENP